MKRTKTLLALFFPLLPLVSDAQELHYDRPAEFFEEALVVGNGRLGATVYGGTAEDRISLNDITLWTGEPDLEPVNPDASRHLPEVRAALDREDYKAADSLVMRIQGHESEKYEPLGTLYIDYLGREGSPTGYSRRLSLATATATTEYSLGGSGYRTEYFASAPDSVIVVRITSGGEGKVSARIRLDCQLPHEVTSDGDRLVCSGYAAYTANSFYETGEHGERFFYDPGRGIHFRTIVAVQNKGGKVTAEEGTLLAEGCREVTLLIANATSFNGAGKDPVKEGRAYEAEVSRVIAKAIEKGYDAIRKDQIEDYQRLYGRVSLDLGMTEDSIRSLTTDRQLRLYTQEGQRNPELEALYFQYGRYLLISSSRTPGVPANLQGLWNEHLSAPWRSNYTVNINLEENYWGAETTNLGELHAPLLTFIKAMERSGRQSARAYYGIGEGWCAGHNSDIWAMTNPIGEGVANPQWANWPMGGAWLSTHIWEHYTFSRDRAFLESFYPTLKGAAEFCLSWLVEKDGELITSFSTSPENMYRTPDGYEGNTLYGGTADLAIIRECVTDAMKAAAELGKDEQFRKAAAEKLSRLRPYHTGSRGNLLEWYHDWEDADWTHRHQSHLIGLYPGHHISPGLTPDLARAAARSLEIKGDMTTGWSTGWRINLYARLLDGERAYHMVRTLLKYVSPDGYQGPDKMWGGGTYPNLLDAHSPFQIDGNFGGSAGMAEMLMQSDTAKVTLLPACPGAWDSGSVSGLRSRCGMEVAFSWEDGTVTSVTLTALADTTATLCCNGSEKEVSLKAGETRTLGKNEL